MRYFSKKFPIAQQKYSTIEKETLALMLPLQHFEVYLGGSNHVITVYTDHNHNQVRVVRKVSLAPAAHCVQSLQAQKRFQHAYHTEA